MTGRTKTVACTKCSREHTVSSRCNSGYFRCPDCPRQCSVCGDEFPRTGKAKYGEYRCQKCGALRRRDYLGTAHGRFVAARNIAERRGLEWGLDADEYGRLAVMPCAYCGWPLTPTGVGLDRIDSTLGYIPSNVVPCCWECNQAKNTYFTREEMETLIGPAIAAVKRQRQEQGKPICERDGKSRGWGRPRKYLAVE